MEMTVDSSEFDALVVQMRTNVGRVGSAGSTIVRKYTLLTDGYAKILCPVDTGHLKGSITSSFSGSGRSAQTTGSVTAGASYAGYVELGTSRMAPQPFMRPALDRSTPQFVAACAQLGAGIARGAV
jgi:HK97 gp10 family phage protein